jgi:hypothetical protein
MDDLIAAVKETAQAAGAPVPAAVTEQLATDAVASLFYDFPALDRAHCSALRRCVPEVLGGSVGNALARAAALPSARQGSVVFFFFFFFFFSFFSPLFRS